MHRRSFLAAGLAATLPLPAAHAAPALERDRLALGVGGKSVLYYLPLTVAERLGYFHDEGLTVEIADLAGGARVLQALLGGSTEVGVLWAEQSAIPGISEYLADIVPPERTAACSLLTVAERIACRRAG